jgi:adenosylcobinamide-phosphate synthase
VIAAWKLAAAYALDLLVGDPEWFPHPVRLIGAGITAGSRHLHTARDVTWDATRDTTRHTARQTPTMELLEGAAFAAGMVAASAAAGRALCRVGGRVDRATGCRVGCRIDDALEILLAWTTLATRNLLDEAGSVLDALDGGDLVLARQRLARIVGRDTADLDEAEVVRAVIETAAESTCDGIVAPLMYLAAGGVPAAQAYKTINTLDSMIGHREQPYTYFGRFAARLDDVSNLVPARVAAGAIALAATLTGQDGRSAIRVWREDGGHHASPNSGQMEASMAGALGVRLGGVNFYDRQPTPGETIHATGAAPGRAHGRAALRIVGVASALVFSGAFALALWSNSREEARR